MNKTRLLMILLSCFYVAAQAQETAKTVKINLEKGEKVWAGVIGDGEKMPLKTGYTMDFSATNKYNQTQPLILSNKGQYVWSENPFSFTVKENEIEITTKYGDVITGKHGKTLREVRKYVADTYFPASGLLPDTLLFSSPQYNTWIELNYNHNQADILKYAKAIISNGLPAGVIMIDDTWQEDFGIWNFHPRRFPNPQAMVDQLHAMGFKVMLWICPFISPDQTQLYNKLSKDNALLMEGNSQRPIMIRWWDGVSAVLDFSNPKAVEWFQKQLNYLVTEYKIDGFKFDAGDLPYYPTHAKSTGAVHANTQSELYAQIGTKYPFNEYRACWKMGGQPLVQRLGDKQHSWKDLQNLIPGMIVEGLSGYPFCCPDMIGGGEISAFQKQGKLNQELIVRSAQCHAMMPMMQFSVAPWRVLDSTHLSAVKKAVAYREKIKSTLIQLAQASATNGEPILRSMEYVFPMQGFENEISQFMIGDDILVAPVLTDQTRERNVVLPKGHKWKDEYGKIYKGGTTILINVPLDRLPYFKAVK